MRSFMSLQVSLLTESLLTNGAGERPYVLVHPHVHGQVVCLGENLPTDLPIFKFPPASFIVYGLKEDINQYSYLSFWLSHKNKRPLILKLVT